MEGVRAGGDRQELHEIIRQHSLDAWAMLQSGQPNPLIPSLCSDARLLNLLSAQAIRDLLHADSYVGDAPDRARQLATQVREMLK